MKLDTETLDILKNFATINPSLAVKQGNVVKTISLSQSVIAKATLKQSFEADFAIYDLSNFLSALSMFDGVNLDFSDDRFVTLSNDEKSAMVRYFFVDPTMVVKSPEKDFDCTKSNIKFRLTKQTLADLIKAASVLNLPEIVLIGDGTNVVASTIDPKRPNSNQYKKVIGENSAEFTANFKIENIKFIPNDYDVSIVPPKKKEGIGIAYFQSPSIEYWVAVEGHSKL